jgi:choline dehydrogenase-like flavoprotein
MFGVMNFDAIVVGSGFGGAMAARVLVEAGWRVLMLERGGWVTRGAHNWTPEGVGQLTEHYSLAAPYLAEPAGPRPLGAYQCVGGPSVFYGGVSLRFRERDFEPDPAITGGSGASWPFRYRDLEPFYLEAERILGVAGLDGDDPTAPPRSAPYPFPPAELAPVSRRIAGAARALGLHPFQLPLAINHGSAPGRSACIACNTCDGFACAVGAKNDLATTVLEPLVARGLRLEAGAVVTRLLHEGGRITGVEVAPRDGEGRTIYRAREVILAAGAIATPHLLLASGVEALNPAGDLVGRYLMRHYNEILFGIFLRPPDRENRFHKQLGIHDLYFGAEAGEGPAGPVGAIQQLPTPPVALVRAELPARGASGAVVKPHRAAGDDEDQPEYENRVLLDQTARRWGSRLIGSVTRATSRGGAGGVARCSRRAGAVAIYATNTFSTAWDGADGPDPAASVLDPVPVSRGVLTVTDAGVFPPPPGEPS